MKKLWLLGLLSVLITACRPPEKFSDIPRIEFISLQPDSLQAYQANLVIYFEDGDGDIGLNDADTTGIFAPDSPYHYNFFIDYYEKRHGEWVLVDMIMPLHSRIPRLSDAETESISGQISILTYCHDPSSSYDTSKLSCYIVDRALHKSNVIETPEIIRK